MLFMSKNLTAGFLALLSAAAANFALASQEEAKFFETAAYNYVSAHFRNLAPDTKVIIEVDKIDPTRDFGGRCEGFLTAEITGGNLRPSSTVKMVCSDPKNPFTLYIPVKITSLKARIVASRDISRGEILSASDYSEEFVSAARMPQGIVTNSRDLIGVRVKREVKQGDFFVLNNICTVCKGDRVSIEASSGGLSLKTTGEAVEDGNLNDTIRVRNLRTKKVIPGRVAGPGSIIININ